MNYISFIFFGTENDFTSVFLKELNLVKFEPIQENLKGLYAVETKYGRKEYRKLSLEYKSADESDFLIYRYLTENELNLLKNDLGERKIYILANNFLNFDYFAELLKSSNLNLNIIYDSGNENIKDKSKFSFVNLSPNLIYKIEKPKKVSKIKNEESSSSSNIFLLFAAPFLRFLLNPVNELNRLVLLLRVGNLRVVSRFLELLLFIIFLFRIFFFNPIASVARKIYYTFYSFFGGLKVIWIKVYFFTRHIVLMSWYKIFGFFVDIKNMIARIIDLILDTVFYKFIHKIFHKYVVPAFTWAWVEIFSAFIYKIIFPTINLIWLKVLSPLIFDFIIGKIIYRIIYPSFSFIWLKIISPLVFDIMIGKLYYKVILEFIYYKIILRQIYYGIIVKIIWGNLINKLIIQKLFYALIWQKLLHNNLLPIFNEFRFNYFPRAFNFIKNIIIYDIRHVVLMVWYKLYGLSFDFALWVYRVMKLYILWPVRKIYWMFRFQYYKRIKKIILDEKN